ncbi:hypothetical protein B0H11DRAFT_2195659 [Mycena galericulata]|nr:hypothetical protein B0H11DRAFT_2195659 [Mycena galericulata]
MADARNLAVDFGGCKYALIEHIYNAQNPRPDFCDHPSLLAGGCDDVTPIDVSESQIPRKFDCEALKSGGVCQEFVYESAVKKTGLPGRILRLLGDIVVPSPNAVTTDHKTTKIAALGIALMPPLQQPTPLLYHRVGLELGHGHGHKGAADHHPPTGNTHDTELGRDAHRRKERNRERDRAQKVHTGSRVYVLGSVLKRALS